MLVIPGSRGDYSYLVEPVPSAQSLLPWPTAPVANGSAASAGTPLAARFSVDQLGRTPW